MQKKLNCDNIIESKDSIFNFLGVEEKEILLRNHLCASFKKGDIIYKEGDKPSGLVCLSVGKVKVFKEGVGGREQIVRMARPVNFIGYRALFADESYNSSAVAIEDCTICILDKESLLRVMRNNGELGIRMTKYLAQELGFSTMRTVSLTQKHIRGRLAESLLFLSDTYGFEDDGTTLRVYLSREDLASLSNMTTSNAIRTLSTFAIEEVIGLEGRKIKLLDLHRLLKISEMG